MTPGIFALLFILAMAGIVKLFPNNKSGSDAVPNDDQLTKFTAWGKISGWIMLAVLILCLYLFVGPIPDYRQQTLPHDKALVYAVLPDRYYWFFISFVFMIGFSAVIYTVLTKLYMWSDFDGFINYSNKKSRYNAYRAVFFICGPFLFGGLILLYFLWGYGIFIYKDKITVHGYLTTKAKTYTYTQVKKIAYMPETPKSGAHYQVNFMDGEYWNTLSGLWDDSTDNEVNYIRKQSGLKIDTLNNDPQ